MVVSANEKLILSKFHIIKINKTGWRIILNKIIKFEIFISVFSNFWERIIPAAKRAHGAAEFAIKSRALLILIGISISRKIIVKPKISANSGRLENCFINIFFNFRFLNFIRSNIIRSYKI